MIYGDMVILPSPNINMVSILLQRCCAISTHLVQLDYLKLLSYIIKGTLYNNLPNNSIMFIIRYMMMALAVRVCFGICDDDIIYITLPLYHTNGGCLGAGQLLLAGSTIALRRKFSASQHWNDCIKYRCTVSCRDEYFCP